MSCFQTSQTLGKEKNNIHLFFSALLAKFFQKFTQDFRVADDRADLPKGLLARLLHLNMGVGQHLSQLGHDAWQAGGQLLRRTESHGTKQLHRTLRKESGDSEESSVC